MKKVEVVTSVLLVCSCVSVNTYGSDADLCRSDEIMIASCHLNEKKIKLYLFVLAPIKK